MPWFAARITQIYRSQKSEAGCDARRVVRRTPILELETGNPIEAQPEGHPIFARQPSLKQKHLKDQALRMTHVRSGHFHRCRQLSSHPHQ